MVVEPDGRFLTQREHPRLALVRPQIEEETLSLTAPELPPLRLPTNRRDTSPLKVTVWSTGCVAADQGTEAAQWFSQVLGQEVRLVWMPEDTSRPIDGGDEGAITFADGYPILLCHQASLDDLNRRLDDPIPMNRFRPNVVVSGGQAWDEDRWTRITGEGLSLEMAKPCERCKVTTVDQETGETGKEPLRTLATFRKLGDGVCFGENAIHHGRGAMRVGQTLRAHL